MPTREYRSHQSPMVLIWVFGNFYLHFGSISVLIMVVSFPHLKFDEGRVWAAREFIFSQPTKSLGKLYQITQ